MVQIGTNWTVECRISTISRPIVSMSHWSCHAANFQMHRHCQPNGRKISAVSSSIWKWCIKVSKELWPITMDIHWMICRCSSRALNRNRCEQPKEESTGAFYSQDSTMFKSLALGKQRNIWKLTVFMKEVVLLTFFYSTDTNPVKLSELLSNHSKRLFSISAWHRLNQSKVFIKPMKNKHTLTFLPAYIYDLSSSRFLPSALKWKFSFCSKCFSLSCVLFLSFPLLLFLILLLLYFSFRFLKKTFKSLQIKWEQKCWDIFLHTHTQSQSNSEKETFQFNMNNII